jgi:hypothetical protein
MRPSIQLDRFSSDQHPCVTAPAAMLSPTVSMCTARERPDRAPEEEMG